MRDIKKDVPAILGLVASASLAVVSGGLITPALGSAVSGFGASFAANLVSGFTPAKIKKWFIAEHPDKLNHSIKKLFVASINHALDNINVLFSEANYSEEEKKAAKKLIKDLQKQLPNMLLSEQHIRLDEPEIKRFLYENGKEDAVGNFIETNFSSFGIVEPLKSFLSQNLPAQIQLCFGEGLKDPSNQNAWIAFQRMLMEEIRNDIKQIADTQQSIKDDLSDLKFTKSGFSKKQMTEIHELVELLNNKKLVEVKIKNSLNQSLQSIENKANEIIKITTETNITVSQLKTLVEKIERQNKFNQLIVALLVGGLFAAVFFIAYTFVNQPFTATIQIYGWGNEQHNPLDGKGTLVLTLGGKTEKAPINRQGEAIFKDILPQFNGQTISACIEDTEGEPYYLPDSIIKIEKNNTAKVQVLLRGLEKLQGMIIDNISGEGLPNVAVTVADITATTNEQGNFLVEIPIEKQSKEQKITVRKDGYESKRETISMTGEYNAVLKRK